MIPGKWLIEAATAQPQDPRASGHGSEIPSTTVISLVMTKLLAWCRVGTVP